ncbi:site-specific integrase [Acinetobacter sp. MD2(2019)]|uniref:tyrosine-type recombinase/integrase n=1 Tax=Acinetobacter sp. MD2(2019) TaxID=2605273 RepID=UPI002D1F75CA|nr:site-specific integrase [Acinetobacter sp. MD2(2019)]MEB3754309.1 site-specific integrase [Acinetobacter sp. MD2(2019)]
MLTKQQIDAIKPTGKLQKHSDGDMLYIFTPTTGKKVWKVLFTLNGKKGTATVGSYPTISIKEARLKRDEIKLMLSNGINPSQKKQDEKLKILSSMSFNELLNLYIREVTPTHKGARWEEIRLKKIIADFPRLMIKPVDTLDQSDMIYFRNERLKHVQGSSVNREMQLLGGVFRYAIRELRIIKTSPLTDVDKPKDNPHRERRITDGEIKLILESYSYDCTYTPINKRQQTAWALMFAIETAMRASEITGLLWKNIFSDHVLLPDTKNGTARRVPLSLRAIELLELMRGIDDIQVMTIKSDALSTGFTKRMRELKIQDLRFHDTRHEAATRLAQKLAVHDLAKVTGHRDLSMLMRYYNPTATELADKINSSEQAKNG